MADTGDDRDETHPALQAAHRSWHCATTGDKEAWLALMADDVVIEDPIGVGPTNPTGAGVRGRAAVAEFFDANIGPNELTMEARDSRVAGNESAHVIDITTRFPDGSAAQVTGIFTYRVDDDGLLTNLRGYWTMDDLSFVGAGE